MEGGNQFSCSLSEFTLLIGIPCAAGYQPQKDEVMFNFKGVDGLMEKRHLRLLSPELQKADFSQGWE